MFLIHLKLLGYLSYCLTTRKTYQTELETLEKVRDLYRLMLLKN